MTLRFCGKIKLPSWTVPLFAGAMGVIADLPLDPLAMKQVAQTNEGLIGRWTWFIAPTDAAVLEVPIYNFTGWMLLCGYAAAFLLLGLCFVVFFALLVAWRGRMRERLTWKEDWAIPVVFGVFHLSVLLFGVIGGHWDVVLFGLPFSLLQMGVIAFGFTRKKVLNR